MGNSSIFISLITVFSEQTVIRYSVARLVTKLQFILSFKTSKDFNGLDNPSPSIFTYASFEVQIL